MSTGRSRSLKGPFLATAAHSFSFPFNNLDSDCFGVCSSAFTPSPKMEWELAGCSSSSLTISSDEFTSSGEDGVELVKFSSYAKGVVAPLDLGVEGGEESMLFQRPELLEIGGKAGTLMREGKKKDARQRDRFHRDNAWVKCLG